MLRVCLLACFTIWFFSACKRNVEPSPASLCDSSNMTFNSNIKPIFKANCYSCHSQALSDSTGIMNLESYATIKTYLSNDYHADGIYGSMFMHIIRQEGSVPNMPPNYRLSTCEINQIQAWIQRQAPL